MKVLGKAGADGRWYRCMALRDTDVKIPDLSLPPPSIVNALLPGTIIGQEKGPATTAGVSSRGGLRSSQLQQDVVMEDPLKEAMEEGLEGEEERGEHELTSFVSRPPPMPSFLLPLPVFRV